MTVLGSQRNQGEGSTVFSLLYGFPFALQFCVAELRMTVLGSQRNQGEGSAVLALFTDFPFILHFFQKIFQKLPFFIKKILYIDRET